MATTCFPRIADPNNLVYEDFFRSNFQPINDALCFRLSQFDSSIRLKGLQVVNSTIRDAYFQLVWANNAANAIATSTSFLSQFPLFFPAKSTIFLDNGNLLKVPTGSTNLFLFARVSETHEVYTPFLRTNDGEISGQSSYIRV